MYGDTTYLWDVSQGECIGVVERPPFGEADSRRPSWIDCEGVLRDRSGQDIGIRIDDPKRSPAWVTGARLLRCNSANGNGPRMRIADSWEIEPGVCGQYDEHVSFLCPIQRTRASLPVKVIETIDAIVSNGSDPDSPVLQLPDDAWDDEPDLDFPCPECGQTHRSTPFYVDRR